MLVGAMKIVKGDIVYLRSGKAVAGINRLKQALGIKDDAAFQAAREKLSMAEQIAMANKESGVRGKVMQVLPREGKVIVEGMNIVTKHQKARSTGAMQVQQAGRIQMPAPIPVSRVMLVCPNCDKPTRVGMRVQEDQRRTLAGEKTVKVRVRVCKQCGQEIGRPTEKIGTV